MESGSVVRYSGKFRTPRSAAQNSLARSSGECRIFILDRSSAPGHQPSKARPASGFLTDNSISGREIPSSGERHFAPTGFLLSVQLSPNGVLFRAAVFGRTPFGLAWSKQ